MDLPFYIILIVYAVGVLVFFVLSVFDVYHLVRYEAFTAKSKIYLTIYSLVFIGLIVGALFMVGNIDWMDTFEIFSYGSTSF